MLGGGGVHLSWEAEASGLCEFKETLSRKKSKNKQTKPSTLSHKIERHCPPKLCFSNKVHCNLMLYPGTTALLCLRSCSLLFSLLFLLSLVS